MRFKYLIAISVLTTLIAGVNSISAQYLGLVSKNCDSYFESQCGKLLIDKSGKEVPLKLDPRIVLEDFDADAQLLIASYRDDSKHLKGLIDLLGRLILKPTYESIGSFSEGLAFVKLSDRKSGFIDKAGKLVIQSSFFEDTEMAERPRGTNYFSDGLSLVEIQIDYSLRASRPVYRYGFIDGKGKLVVGKTNIPLVDLRGLYSRPRFENAQNFSEDLAAVRLKGKWGYVNKKDIISIPFQFERANNFSEGLASVKKDGKYGFIDKSGRFKIEPKFDEADEFSEGLAAVEVEKLWGYVDTTGSLVIKPQFSRRPEKFSDGMAMIFEPGSGPGKGFGFIDKNGTVVIQPQFGGAGNFVRGLASVYTKGGRGFIRKDGTYLWDPRPMGAKNKLYGSSKADGQLGRRKN